MQRMLSIRSQETINTLEHIELHLTAMRAQADEVDAYLAAPPKEGLPIEMRNELAQLHGDANKLLATRIDAILTSAYALIFSACPFIIVSCCQREPRALLLPGVTTHVFR